MLARLSYFHEDYHCLFHNTQEGVDLNCPHCSETLNVDFTLKPIIKNIFGPKYPGETKYVCLNMLETRSGDSENGPKN